MIIHVQEARHINEQLVTTDFLVITSAWTSKNATFDSKNVPHEIRKAYTTFTVKNPLTLVVMNCSEYELETMSTTTNPAKGLGKNMKSSGRYGSKIKNIQEKHLRICD